MKVDLHSADTSDSAAAKLVYSLGCVLLVASLTASSQIIFRRPLHPEVTPVHLRLPQTSVIEFDSNGSFTWVERPEFAVELKNITSLSTKVRVSASLSRPAGCESTMVKLTSLGREIQYEVSGEPLRVEMSVVIEARASTTVTFSTQGRPCQLSPVDLRLAYLRIANLDFKES